MAAQSQPHLQLTRDHEWDDMLVHKKKQNHCGKTTCGDIFDQRRQCCGLSRLTAETYKRVSPPSVLQLELHPTPIARLAFYFLSEPQDAE